MAQIVFWIIVLLALFGQIKLLMWFVVLLGVGFVLFAFIAVFSWCLYSADGS